MNKVVIAEGDNALDRIFSELEVEKTLQNIENVNVKIKIEMYIPRLFFFMLSTFGV